MLLADAANPGQAMDIFQEELTRIREEMKNGDFSSIEHQLLRSAERFRKIPLKQPAESVPTINLTGEIFVRRDELSRQYLTESLAKKGFATVCTPVAEWLHYSDFLVAQDPSGSGMSKIEWLGFLAKKKFMVKYEKRIKAALNKSGLVHAEPLKIEEIIDTAERFISRELAGEAVLTVGGALSEIVTHVCGVIAIGPFGCMPNRLSEAILNEIMNRDDKLASDPGNSRLRAALTDVDDLPFLAIESDGSPFPQLINAKLEAFCLRALRLHRQMLANGGARKRKVRLAAGGSFFLWK